MAAQQFKALHIRPASTPPLPAMPHNRALHAGRPPAARVRTLTPPACPPAPPPPSTPHPRYALGLFSRSAGRLTVMPAEGGRILRLEPRIRGEAYGPRATTTVIEPGQLREANMRLVEEFGSQVGFDVLQRAQRDAARCGCQRCAGPGSPRPVAPAFAAPLTRPLHPLLPDPQRRKRQLKAREAGKVEAGHVSAGAAVLGLISSAGAAAGQTKVGRVAWRGRGLALPCGQQLSRLPLRVHLARPQNVACGRAGLPHPMCGTRRAVIPKRSTPTARRRR